MKMAARVKALETKTSSSGLQRLLSGRRHGRPRAKRFTEYGRDTIGEVDGIIGLVGFSGEENRAEDGH